MSSPSRRILLIAPPVQFRMASGHLAGSGFNFGSTFPPVGLLYLGAVLGRAGHEVRVIDYAEEPYSDDAVLAAAAGYDLIGLAVLRTNRDQVQHLVDVIRGRYPDVPIICGGPDVSLRPTLFTGTQVTVIGEAEETIGRIVDAVCDGGDLASCPGVYYRDPESGKELYGPPAPLPQDLDAIPFPDRTLVDRHKYGAFRGRSRGRTALVITTRGCPFHCSFCSRLAQNRNTYRMRSAENVLEELEQLHQQGYEYIFFGDSNFVVNRKRTVALLNGVIERKFGFRIILGCRADMVDREILELMHAAGTMVVSYGFESGTQDMLDFLRKGTTVAENRRAAELTDRAGMFVHGNFIIGGKSESDGDIQATIEASQDPAIDAAFFNVLSYQYGSRLWKDARQEGVIPENELNVLASRENHLSPHLEADLRRFHHRALLGFYCRPAYLWRLFRKSVALREMSLFRLITGSMAEFLVEFARNRVREAVRA